jgi:murein DD-endopeptidase MepM/ murein hydrolase activator NlpD
VRSSDAVAHIPLGIFRNMSRRRLAIGTVLLSMALVVINNLPASATTIAHDEEVTVEGQELVLTDATLAASVEKVPVGTERDDFSLTYFTPVQWPLAPGTPISSYFGGRASPCPGCSSYHHGVDFTPGYGTPVHAIADGVVVSRPISGLGTFVVIQHRIDNQIVYSVYGHMITGSAVPVGTQVHMGDVVGNVGNTGQSSGTHLHLAIMVGEYNFIDPLPWMRSHVTEAWG